jgi:hypothetical protein
LRFNTAVILSKFVEMVENISQYWFKLHDKTNLDTKNATRITFWSRKWRNLEANYAGGVATCNLAQARE